jgi:hypothetical protein
MKRRLLFLRTLGGLLGLWGLWGIGGAWLLGGEVALSVAQDPLHREIRGIRRAYLDVTGLVPTPEEVDWYTVYNTNGLQLAAEELVHRRGGQRTGWTVDRLLSADYQEAPPVELERGVLERNVVYLAGLLRSGDYQPEWFEAGRARFIQDALLVGDDKAGGAIEYMVNGLTCRPASAAEENALMGIFNKVALKSDERTALETVLLHIFQLPDCRTR